MPVVPSSGHGWRLDGLLAKAAMEHRFGDLVRIDWIGDINYGIIIEVNVIDSRSRAGTH
jgi:hypothetical protein